MSSSTIVLIALVVLAICNFLLTILTKSKRYKGEYGEAKSEEILDRFEKHKYDIYGKTLRNVYIPKAEGGTSEIDVLYVTARGIFVVESKNYSGWIFGKEYDQYWTATLPAGVGKSVKNKFYNPIKQNEGHIKYLREYLKTLYPDKTINFYSLIVFSDRCELKNIKFNNEHALVIQRFELFRTVKSILEKEALSITNVQVDHIYEELNKFTDVDAEVKREHVESIKGKSVISDSDDSDRCPLCGSKLVVRTAKKGSNVGQKFYGCSAFPKCRYTKEYM